MLEFVNVQDLAEELNRRRDFGVTIPFTFDTKDEVLGRAIKLAADLTTWWGVKIIKCYDQVILIVGIYGGQGDVYCRSLGDEISAPMNSMRIKKVLVEIFEQINEHEVEEICVDWPSEREDVIYSETLCKGDVLDILGEVWTEDLISSSTKDDILNNVYLAFVDPMEKNRRIRNIIGKILCEDGPSTCITYAETKSFGYEWPGMIAVPPDVAKKLYKFGIGFTIYKLFSDNTEAEAESLSDMEKHEKSGGMFGIEKKEWDRFCNSIKGF